MEITVENPQRGKKERPYDNSYTTPEPAVKGFSTLLKRHVYTLAVYSIARNCNQSTDGWMIKVQNMFMIEVHHAVKEMEK